MNNELDSKINNLNHKIFRIREEYYKQLIIYSNESYTNLTKIKIFLTFNKFRLSTEQIRRLTAIINYSSDYYVNQLFPTNYYKLPWIPNSRINYYTKLENQGLLPRFTSVGTYDYPSYREATRQYIRYLFLIKNTPRIRIVEMLNRWVIPEFEYERRNLNFRRIICEFMFYNYLKLKFN